MIKASYKDSTELREYARKRMLASIQRNDPQAALYWFKQLKWAEKVTEGGITSNLKDLDVSFILLGMETDAKRGMTVSDFEADVEMYTKLKHLNTMYKNQGKKPFKLTLDWLRLIAAQYETPDESSNPERSNASEDPDL